MILASDWIDFHADRTPDKLALVDQGTGRKLTYAELNERCSRLATYLRDVWEAKPGDILAILAKNAAEYFEFQFACIKLGAIMLPLNWRLAVPELLYILNDSEAMGLVYDYEFADRVQPLVEGSKLEHVLRLDFGHAPVDSNPAYDDAIANSAPDVIMDPQTTHDTRLTIMYTAGTTGHPKGVLITHGMNFWNAINISTPIGLNRESVNYVVLPCFHTGGLNLYANPTFHWGGTVVVAREFDPGEALKTLADPEIGVSHFLGVPAIYLFMSQHESFETTDLSGVKAWGCGGAPMPVALLETYSKRGFIIQLGFGMTETSPTVFLIDKRRALQKPSSVGKPMLHTRVRVVREDFSDVAPGEMGEVVISGPNITPEYWRRPDANENNFTIDEYGNRWLHSGDAGTVDDEGCIYVVDRYKDMYISGGENVYPAEIEQVIFQLENVADVGVIGVPDEKWGEVGKAVVVKKPGTNVSENEIIDHCKQNLAKYKVPKSVAFIDELPRNAAGKILKRTLREQFSS